MNTTTPDKVAAGSKIPAHFVCDQCGYRYIVTPFGYSHANIPCPRCRGLSNCGGVIPYEQSVAYKYPELIQDWDFAKNDYDPAETSSSLRREVWWYCHECGTTWKAQIAMRTKGKRRCPDCGVLRGGQV